MTDPDVLQAKLAVIDRCLARVADVRGDRRPELQAVDVDDIVALNLQRAIQASLTLASHVVAAEGYGVPDSKAAAFTLLEQREVIDAELAGSLRRMAAFRNVSIYQYSTVDPAIVESIVDKHLGDLRELGARLVAAVGPR